MLKAIEIEGFKSFGSPARRIDLSPLTFVVGPNASGKTNFLSALRFLQSAVTQDAEFAVNDMGGASEVRCKLQREKKQPKPFRVRVWLDDCVDISNPLVGLPASKAGAPKHAQVSDFDYTLAIDLRREDGVPVILEERLRANLKHGDECSTYTLSRDLNAVKISDPLQPTSSGNFVVPEQERARPAINAGFFSFPAVMFRRLVHDWAFYNVSPLVARQSYRELPDSTLGLSGENLSVVLHRLEARNGEHGLKTITENLRGAVPGFESVHTVKSDFEGRWALTVHETKVPGSINPSSISDGTIRLLALMVIANLGAQKRSLIAIEEPENSIHPHLSKHLVDIFRETSSSSQIIATTHNPAFLDFLEPNEVLLCGKVEGFTRIRRVDDVAEIERFRKHFTLGELWVQGTFDEILD